jgi:hypothetical protein
MTDEIIARCEAAIVRAEQSGLAPGSTCLMLAQHLRLAIDEIKRQRVEATR